MNLISEFLERRCFFSQAKIDQLLPIFAKEGIDNLKLLRDLQPQDLIDVGVSRIQANQIFRYLAEPDPIPVVPIQVPVLGPPAPDPEPQHQVFPDMHEPSDPYSHSMIKSKVHQYQIYETYEDQSSESRITKIRIKRDEFSKFMNDLKASDVKIVGLYGYLLPSLRAITQILQSEVPIHLEEVKNEEECLLAFRADNKVVLYFKTEDNLYDIKNSFDSKGMIITYMRYLIDLCPNIFFVASSDFKVNEPSLYPHFDMESSFMQIEELKNSKEEKLGFVEANYVAKYHPYSDKIKLAQDFANMVYEYEIRSIVNSNIIRKKIDDRDYRVIKYQGTRYYSEMVELNELIRKIKMNWPNDEVFFYDKDLRPFEERMIKLFEVFVIPDKIEEFKKITYNFQNILIERRREILKNTRVLKQNFEITLYQQLVETLLTRFTCTGTKESGGYMSSFFSSSQCTKACLKITSAKIKDKYQYDFKSIDWTVLSHQIDLRKDDFKDLLFHHSHYYSFKDEIRKINNEIDRNTKDFDDQYLIEMKKLRAVTLNEFFYQTKEILRESEADFENEVKISFAKITVLPGDKGNLNWSFNKTTSVLQIDKKYFKEERIELKSVHFMTENEGLLIIHAPREQVTFIFSFCLNPLTKRYLYFDNVKLQMNIGHFKTYKQVEDPKFIDVYNRKCQDKYVKQIKDACFLPDSQKILIINQDSLLMEYDINSNQLILSQITTSKSDSEVPIRKPVKPSIGQAEQVQTSSEGKLIFLFSKDVVDIFDLVWNLQRTISIKKDDLKQLKVFNFEGNSYLLQINKFSFSCSHIKGLSQEFHLEKKHNAKDTKRKENPALDILKWAIKRFGPQSDFIDCPSRTTLGFLNITDKNDQKHLIQYYSNLKLDNFKLAPAPSFSLPDKFFGQIEKLAMQTIMITRNPLHLATIENSTLIPLQNGVNVTNEIISSMIEGEQSKSLLELLLESVKFGIYEDLLQEAKEDIMVISIVGKQSGGKSYVMNRLFGTRFNVSASRCTDGIWMSITRIRTIDGKQRLAMILDCEGLFSIRRNDSEEIKLCLTLAAISDIMILNQDLSFNRNIQDLFNKFSRSIGKIKGEKLFKGILVMLVRDTNQDEAKQALNEFDDTIKSVYRDKGKENFIKLLFQSKVQCQTLCHFEKEYFPKEIEYIRNRFLSPFHKEKSRWNSPQELIDNFKQVLCQIFIDDDSDLDESQFRIKCERYFQQSLDQFFVFTQKKGADEYICIQPIEIDGSSYQIKISQSSIKITNDGNSEEMKTDENEAFSAIPTELVRMFIDQSTPYALQNHNQWISSFKIYVKNFFNERKELVLAYFKSQMSFIGSDFTTQFETYALKLDQTLQQICNKMYICGKPCRSCDRLCQDTFNHEFNCKCGTNHICEAQCTVSDGCIAHEYLCIERYGHKDQHRCGFGNHRCQVKCSIDKCSYICSGEANHSEETQHLCENVHPCDSKCSDSVCTKTCSQDKSKPHDEHFCEDKQCIHKCLYCDLKCCFPNHFHQKFIADSEFDKLMFDFEEGKEVLLEHHLCGNEHNCPENCNKPGICNYECKRIDKVWENSFGEFPYTYFKPEKIINNCLQKIPKFLAKHEGTHQCKEGEHRCDQQCPECGSFCMNNYGHEGLHQTNTHRNKEKSVYVTKDYTDKLTINRGGVKTEMKIGESCQPENCQESCGRRGRAHYHLKQCLGKDKCEAKKNPLVRHSNERYYPFEEQDFDMQLCQDFWNSQGWLSPLDVDKQLEVVLCNTYCYHSETERVYCSLKAWHEGDHEIDCPHSKASKDIDVVFCIDATGSMGSHIEQAKEAVKEIVKRFMGMRTSHVIMFAFVTYGDHTSTTDMNVTRIQDINTASEILNQIAKISADMGGGDTPEAVFDGLSHSVQKVSWRKDSNRYLFHIADAPPHGRQYISGGDTFPDGCPCGLNIETVSRQILDKQIKYKFLQINNSTQLQQKIFKSHLKENYEEWSISIAQDIPIVSTRILMRDLCPDQDIKAKE